MAEPFLAEVRLFSFAFAPKGWAMANGQVLPIAQNQALFSLLGVTYGGNGTTSFALPNLQGRVPLHFGPSNPLGQQSGSASVTLTTAQMPMHMHPVMATTQPGSEIMATETVQFAQNASPDSPLSYGTLPLQNMAVSAVTSYGSTQPHENRQPFLALTFCIALQGVFPSRN